MFGVWGLGFGGRAYPCEHATRRDREREIDREGEREREEDVSADSE